MRFFILFFMNILCLFSQNMFPENTLTLTMKDVSEPALFDGCQDSKDKKKCFNENLNTFIAENFDKTVANTNNLSGLLKIYCAFKIDYLGYIQEIKVRAPHPALKKEAERVLETLPIMSPATKDEKPVNQLFTLPIVFEVKNNNTKKLTKKASKDYPFSKVATPPLFPNSNCLDTETKHNCFGRQVNAHIQKHFNKKIAEIYNIFGVIRIYCMFKINYQGYLTKLNVKAPHPALKQEAERVIKGLPRLQPAIHNGKPVNILFTLPILFQMDKSSENDNSIITSNPSLSSPHIFKGCKYSSNKTECFKKKLLKFVNKEFDYELVQQYDSHKSKLRVVFEVDHSGKATFVKVKDLNSQNVLEKEMRRVINKLPDLHPSELNVEYKAYKIKYGFWFLYTSNKDKPFELVNSKSKPF